mgnify:FL=1
MTRMLKFVIFAFLFLLGIGTGFIMIFFFSSSSSFLAPSLIDKSIEEAEIITKNNNLKLKVQEERYDTKKEKGIILRQNPNGGISIKKGQTLYVVVSKGVEKVVTPNLINLPLREAQISLVQSGLKLKGVSSISSKKNSETVISQSLEPLSIVPKESDCHLLLSQGGKRPVFVMPKLIGREAKDVLRNLGEYGIPCYINSSVSGVRNSVRQNPLAGYPIDASTTVFLGVEK